MSNTIKLAEYLFTRLRQLGVESIHGVPGDYNLELLDFVEPSGLQWIGNTNELNAGYAADGYAKIKGIAALVTTFGVGELSAINAIAGAYTEFAPVIHIAGTPPRSTQESRALVHHTFNDGEYGRFSQINAHVTIAQASLWDPRTSAEQIDAVLQQCLIHHRPVYIQVPVDLVAVSLPAERLRTKIMVPESLPSTLEQVPTVVSKVLERMSKARRPIILADGEMRPLDIVQDVQAFVDATDWPTWTTPFGKGLLNETRPNFHGINRGRFDAIKVQEFISKADLVLNFGPHHSSTNTYGYSNIPDTAITICFSRDGVKIGNDLFHDLPTKSILSQLNDHVNLSKIKPYKSYPDLPHNYSLSISNIPADNPITQDKLWNILATFLRRGDIVMGETGTPGYGVREMPLPPKTRMFTPVTWLSIGYMLPAAQGAALAQRELGVTYEPYRHARTILFIGDGSFQMTAQELSSIIRYDLNVVVFLINNDGYTIERCIHGRNQGYNNIASWRYLEAPKFFGADEDTYCASARTWGELDGVLKHLSEANKLRMVEVFVDREDAPHGVLQHYLKLQKDKE
ncbi:Pyruvate decarboxylase [Diaporthe amygdali]|uniref:Pyruvate decarboxylase n=1 Tax=Phomopsis amygdali TaxID=1214568 RepID=UPI0022FE23DD|nr:Pyruvate decarboxylase [Diaporthe amygdali]KAJ0114031.1 Pyruvate decarboxylase [Diaporthe amygdali]